MCFCVFLCVFVLICWCMCVMVYCAMRLSVKIRALRVVCIYVHKFVGEFARLRPWTP